MTKSGRFITVEGIEGAGKSTVVSLIRDWLQTHNHPCLTTREPGGTPCAESLRQILLAPDVAEQIQPETELLLMFAGRAQHIANLIAPALAEGKWVISDRFVDASYAYQQGGRGLSVDRLTWLDKWIVGEYTPHLTFLLDLPPEVGLERAKARGPHDRFEQEKLDFFHRVRAVYLERAEQYPERIVVIDAWQPVETVSAALISKLTTLL